MATMNISVPDQMRDYVMSRIATGEYASASDYFRDLVRRDQRRASAAEQWFTREIQPALDDVAAGRVHDETEVDALLDAHFAAMDAGKDAAE